MIFSNKLVSLLRSFSKYDLNRFRKMVRSPYYNEQEDLVRLFDYIHSILKKEPIRFERLDKLQVCKTVWPDIQPDEVQIRRTASELTHLAFQFLILKAREEHPIADLLDLQQQLHQLALKKHLDGVERQFENLMNTDSNRSADYYLSGFRMHHQQYGRSTQSGKKADISVHLEQSERHLDIFYVVQKLKFYVEWLTVRALRATDKGFSESEGFWVYAKRFEDVPLVALYLNVIQCLTNMEEVSYFEKLLKNLAEFAEKLAASDLRDGYHIAQNYCAFNINRGKPEYYLQTLNIYKKMLKNHILLENGVLAEGLYKNIITSGLRVGEFAWVEAFIHDYSGNLPAHLRENARTFNLANLYSHQKQHQKVIETLQNVEYSDVMYAMSSKVILVRTYYDLGELLSLDSLIDSFRTYIRRNKLISSNLKSEYTKFLNLVHQLISLEVYDSKALANLKQKVTATSSATPKKWLLEKIEELEEKRRRPKR